MYNGFAVREDGLTPYYRRFQVHAPYKCYPFGTLIFFRYQSETEKPGKFEPKLIPHILVEITIGPAGRWAHSYGAVRLDKMIGLKRASRASIRRSMDVVFP